MLVYPASLTYRIPGLNKSSNRANINATYLSQGENEDEDTGHLFYANR
jgi:hypothetical protein